MISARTSAGRDRRRDRDDLSSLIKKSPEASKYSEYQHNFAGFFAEQLNVGLLTDGQKRVLHSIENYRTVIVTSATSTGKTFLLAGVAIAMFNCWDRSGVYIAAASPESNLKTLAWGELTRFISTSPHLFKDTLSTDMTISRPEKMPNGKLKPGRSRIQGLTIPSQGRDDKMETAFSGKHHEDSTAFLLDEADGIPDPCYRGINGCMSGSGHERLILFYNPKSRDGEPYDMLEKGTAHHVVLSAFDHPNVQSGYNIIPGAVNRDVTVGRVNEWSSAINPNESPDEFCFQVPDFLVGSVAPDNKGGYYPPLPAGWRRGDDIQMFYKVLGVYPPVSAGYLVNPQKLADAVTRWHIYRQMNNNQPPPHTAPMMMFDVADSPGGDASMVVLRYGDYVDLPIRLIGIDAHDYAKGAAALYHSKKVASCYVDVIGVGAGIPGFMSAQEECKAVIGYKANRKAPWSQDGKFDTVRDYCLYMLARWINNSPTAMIPDDERLLKSLKILTATTTDAVRVKDKKTMRRELGFSPDAMDALAMSFAQPTFFSGGI